MLKEVVNVGLKPPTKNVEFFFYLLILYLLVLVEELPV